jgi:dUTPase
MDHLSAVHEGDRIAQLIIEKIETPAVLEVDVRVQLSNMLALAYTYRCNTGS